VIGPSTSALVVGRFGHGSVFMLDGLAPDLFMFRVIMRVCDDSWINKSM